MGDLPFLVVHGGWLWMVVAPVFVAGVYGAWAGWRRWRARRRARRVRAGLGTPAHELRGAADEAVHAVEGILRSDGECARHRDGTPVACASFWSGGVELDGTSTEEVVVRRARTLHVESERGTVELVGDVTVMVGSREHATRWRALQGAPMKRLCEDAGADDPPPAWKDRPVYRELERGDRVLAYGRLRRAAASGEAGYRDEGGALYMDAAEGSESILLAFARAPKPGRPTWTRVATVLGAGVALFFAGAYAFGYYMIESSRDSAFEMAPHGRPFALPAVDRLTLAAATPFHRDEALERIVSEIDVGGTAEQARLDAAIALDDLRGDCLRGAWTLMQHARHREALERNERCAERDLILDVRARAALAEFDAASDALHELEQSARPGPPTDTKVAIHVLARQWERAAELARRNAEWWRGRGKPSRAYVPMWECLALGLDARAGKAGALAELRARRASPDGGMCAVLAAELTGAADDLDALATVETEGTVGFRIEGARDHLRLIHRPDDLDGARFLTMVAMETSADEILGSNNLPLLPELGLARRGAASVAELAASHPDLAESFWTYLVMTAVHVGHYDDAERYLAAARANLPAEVSTWSLDRAALVLRMRRPGSDWTRIPAHEIEQLFGGWGGKQELVAGDVEPFIEDRLSSEVELPAYVAIATALRAAVASGDGEPLRGVLRRDAFQEWDALPLVARRIETNREPVRDFVRLTRPRLSIEATPWLGRLGSRLALAESLGDDELIATYRELIRRHFEAVTDPEVAMFLYLLSS